MTDYEVPGRYQLWQGDCLEEMSRIEDGSLDAIIADWPYQKTNCHWDSMIPLEPLWKQCKRVIKKNGAIVLTASQPFTSLLVMSNLKWFKWEDVYHKTQANGFLNAKIMPLREHENILLFGKGRVTYNPQMFEKPAEHVRPPRGITTKSTCYGEYKRGVTTEVAYTSYPRSVVRFSNTNSKAGLHPCQKPVALMEYLILTYTNEGDTILDNTFGSCSTGEAALRTNRRFIGIEKDANYFEIGKTRMERVAAELRGELNHLPMIALESSIQ